MQLGLLALAQGLPKRYNKRMRKLLALLLTATLGVLSVNTYAQMPSKLFRQLIKQPGTFPKSRLGELSNKQLDQFIIRLRYENARLAQQNELERQRQAQVFAASRPAVFRVASVQNGGLHSLSGTIFTTSQAGQPEIFGVVPTHVLQDADHEQGTLSKEFSVLVETPQGIQTLPAQVVQLSSTKTGDVALVKFRAEDEEFLSPLSLAPTIKQFPTPVYSQGFARSILTQSSFPVVGTTSAGMLISQLPASHRGERAGFCGSPVITQQTTLAGIHVGSRYLSQDPQQTAFFAAFKLKQLPIQDGGDAGYITPASFLKQMVAAYHHPDLKPLIITFAGQEITRLAVDEYISAIELLDAHMNVVWSRNMDFKVTFTAAEAAFRLYPQVAFVRFQVGKTHWAQDADGWFVQDTDNRYSVLKPLVHP